MNKTYVILKIISGYDVISSIAEENKSTITLENPMLVIMTTSNSGSYIAYLKPYSILSKDNILTLQKAHVSAIYDPNENLIEYYKKMIDFNKKFVEPDISRSIKTSTKVIANTLKMNQTEFKQYSDDLYKDYSDDDGDDSDSDAYHEEEDNMSLSSWDSLLTKTKKIH